MTWTWAEPFAGAAACTLRLVGGRDLAPPVAWMGGKRRLARAILDAMGVPETPPSRVLLADAGPWGWVWPLLLEPESAAAVARVLRSWANEHPRDLWQRLAAQPPAEDLHERAAQWLWLQARSASGVPIWWDGWRTNDQRWVSTRPQQGGGVRDAKHALDTRKDRREEDGEAQRRPKRDTRAATDRGEDLRWPGHQEQRDAWLASDGRGRPRPAGARAVGGRWEKGTPDARPPQDATNGQRGHAGWRMGEEFKKARRGDRTIAQGHPGSWRFDARPCDVAPDRLAGPAGTTNGRTGGMVNPCTIAERAKAIAEAFARVAVTVHHGDAQAQADAHGIPPPFKSGQVGCDCIDCDGTWCVWCLDHHGRRPCPVDEERKAHEPRVLLGKPTWVYLDPPYLGATGYGWDMPRSEVLALARRWHDAGAVVAVSEAEPLELEGWHHVELTREGGKPEWLTLSRPPARLPERQGALFAAEDA